MLQCGRDGQRSVPARPGRGGHPVGAAPSSRTGVPREVTLTDRSPAIEDSADAPRERASFANVAKC